MTKTELLARMASLPACGSATEWVTTQAGSAQEIWDACENGSWLIWYAAKCGVERKTIVLAACLCARESLVYVRPGKEGPRRCIEAVESWCAGTATIDEVKEARRNAYDAYAYAYAYAAADARKKSQKRSAELVRALIKEVPR